MKNQAFYACSRGLWGSRLGIGKGEGLGLGGRAKGTCTKHTECRTGPGVSVRLFPCLRRATSEKKMKILLLLAALSAVCLAAGDYVGVLVRTSRNAAVQDGSR